MVSNTQPTENRLTGLIGGLLDRDYNRITRPVLNAIADTKGIINQRLSELDAEAARLAKEEKRLTPDNPILRALIADLETELSKSQSLINAAATPLQESAVTSAGKIQRQIALPGVTNQQLQTLGIAWNTPDPEAVARLVGYSQSDAWRDLLSKYPDDVLGVIQNQAVRGSIYGWSPLRIAREIRRTTNALPAHVANNLMRTLQLTSVRDSTAIHQTANRDITEMVVRIGTLDARMCLSCVALHGTILWTREQDSNAPVPRVADHHSGRCTAVIIVRGFSRKIITGEEWFNSLPPARQAEQLSLKNSPGKLKALRDGRATLQDFVHRYEDPVFGEMMGEAALKNVLN
jgi:hypothetical protein